jgi:lactate dehydrogenase-like 2-hydroxyacid dehydrogenase
MAKPTVLVTRAIPRAALELLARHAHVDANEADAGYTPDELAARGRSADGIVALLTDRIDDALLARCPGLKVVANVAVGYDNIDVAAAARRGVVVTNTPGVLTDATADFALALLLGVARKVVPADRYVRDGRFREWMMMASPASGVSDRPWPGAAGRSACT